MLHDDVLDNRYIVLLPVASFRFVMNNVFLVTVFAVCLRTKERNYFILVIIIAMN